MTAGAVRRIAVGLFAAVHHVITTRAVLLGLTIAALLGLLADRMDVFGVTLAAAALITAEAVRAESAGRPFASCPLCALTRWGTHKESSK
ncbi:hypothetical protein OG762_51575 (plasmid) [Streptomyces sp. NBC_01136]|uniref:hypothetical protein n=1 Tax=Streptomyces sp. NBC_01136 TaxID=2903754 RepID=UPI002F9101EF|nr:hypothetical protein OG762_51575 [Streptomyces sp. NBC_01136]